MTADLNLCAPAKSICIQRGDTVPFQIQVKDPAGAPLNVTGFGFLLTVDPSDEPVDNSNNLFQLIGTLVTPLSGIVQFSLTALEADQTPGEYFFDIQMTDGAGKLRTIAKGTFTFDQDITK